MQERRRHAARRMNMKLVGTLLALLGVMVFPLRGADEAAPAGAAAEQAAQVKSPVQIELLALLEKIGEKAKNGQPLNETTLAEELAEFDRLLVAHKDEKTDDVAQVLVMKAGLYLEVLGDLDKAAALFRRLKEEFPGSSQAREADNILKAIAIQREALRIQEGLKPGVPFPDFDAKDIEGNPLSIGRLKGTVVLVDFWATWCPGCVEELPHQVALYKKYKARGLEIIGVNMDRERATLDEGLKQHGITWPQYFDGKFWNTTLAEKYGITQLPFNLLIDGDGRIVGKNLHGAQLDAALVSLLGP